ncbi:hypothetical protein Prudu_001240 [Prunus dulcis]|uniref:MATE efflux family protein n=1 Tax=Prunus dulcis TaxID=3755 RepID=A0A4Y1QN52_PRUDU|nr:hypothetical protein Prudu_001240 [Prunus dulcis]
MDFYGSSDGDFPPIHCFADAKVVCYLETTKLWTIAGPIAFNILCNYGINSFTNIFVGHIGNVELSAVAISLSVIANFSFGFLLGMASALETLCSVGKHLLFGQEDDIADLVGKFTIQTIPQMFSLAVNFPTQKFLQAKSRVQVLAWIGFAFSGGELAALLPPMISQPGDGNSSGGYIVYWCNDGWKGLSWLAFKELWSFAKLSLYKKKPILEM